VICWDSYSCIPHAAWVADILDLPMIYIREKLKNMAKGIKLKDEYYLDKKLIVIEDLISTRRKCS